LYSSNQLQLIVTQFPCHNGNRYQCLEIGISGILKPDILSELELPKNLDLNQGIVLWGAAPVWLYAYLVKRCQSVPWIGCYNLELGGFVVVASRCTHMVVGEVFELINKSQCSAILIGGPPNSGKSVLSHALDYTLNQQLPDKNIHLHRAQWDGEGSWYAQMKNRSLADGLNKRSRAKETERFFFYHADAVSKIRQGMELVLVDFGGKPKLDDLVLLHRCTHYIIISKEPKLIPQWHDFCRRQGRLQPLAVIHSVLEKRLEIRQTEPFLEIIAGPWQRGQISRVPEVLLQEVLKLVAKRNNE